MKKFAYLVCWALPSLLFAQYEISINATIFDEVSKTPISFVNVAFNDKPIQAISNEDGTFSLTYDEDYVQSSDLLEFSALGYKSELVSAERFYKFLTNTNKIYLKPEGFVNPKGNVTDNMVDSGDRIIGKVSLNNKPLQGAKVIIRNSLNETRTNKYGDFELEAKPGDIIQVDFIGMKTKTMVIEDRQLNINLEPDGELLDEVLVLGESRSSDLIDLGYNGKKSFDEITYSATTIPKERIGSQYYRLQDLLTGEIAKFNYSRDQSATNPAGFVFDIDGMIFTSANNLQLPYVDPQTIESITVLNSLTATHKYGTLARAGVIVIRTNLQSTNTKTVKQKSALVVGNNYDENLSMLSSKSTANYMMELKKATSFEEAKQIYLSQKADRSLQSVPYFIEVSDYFMKWNHKFANDVLNQIAIIGYTNDKALKTLAFKLEERGEFEKAKTVYQRIAAIRPNEAQSFMSLASIYKKTGHYKQSLNLYKRMLGNQISDIDFTGLQNIITNEIQHILAFHRTKVDYFDLPNVLRSANFKRDVRIVFEWNDPYNEFELQFVNPNKKYYTWHHTKLSNANKMLDEVKNGYAMQEYIIDDAEAGQWIVNLKNLSDEPKLNPTYLKYTVYKNYGLDNETSEVKLVKLFEQNEKGTLDRFDYQ